MDANGETLGRPRRDVISEADPAWSVTTGGTMQNIDQGQLLASIAATLHDCILSVGATGTVLWASPATEALVGWRPDDLAGRPFDVLFPRDSGVELRASVLDRLLAGERVEPFLEVVARRDGGTFNAQLTLGPVHGPDGAVSGAIVVLRDMTSQLSEQRELALALEMSRAHFDQASTPQAILGLEGRLESVNPAWCELFGHGEGWFADCDLLDLVHPVDADEVVARLARLRAGQIDSISFRGLFRSAEGDELSLVLDASLLREATGRPYAIAAWVDADGDDDGARPSLAELLTQRAWDAAVVLDEDLTITFASPAVTRMLGLERGDAVGRSVRDYIHAGDGSLVSDLVDRLRTEPLRNDRAVVRIRDVDGRWRSIEVTAINCLSDPDVEGYVANLRDVTERVRTEEALRLSEELHRTMVESTQEGILATSPEGLVIFANETAAAVLDRAASRLHGEDPVRLLGLREEQRVDGADGDGATSGVETFEVVFRRRRGDERTLRVVRRPLHSLNAHLGSLISIADVTDAREVEHVLRSRALHDSLTGLPNRYLFLDRLETAAARHQRNRGLGTAVLFVDVDRFKGLNDGFGHLVGDAVLREIGARLLSAVRGTDTVGRLGGDEFAVICEETAVEDALLVASRMLGALTAPIEVDGHPHDVSISVGAALAPPWSFDEVVRRADEAMYRAKQLGGGRVWLASHDPA